jgi:hypothetical protein
MSCLDTFRLAVPIVITVSAFAAQTGGSGHSAYFEHYEGTTTCLSCHEQQADDFFHSQHYQYLVSGPGITGANGRKLGKLNTVNDFCTAVQPNWIGLVRNSRGEVISKGCSACHAGLGKLPEQTVSRQQLENIDCLICHAVGYRRDLYSNNDGTYSWRPVLSKDQRLMDTVAKDISLPTRGMCLGCHSESGNGPNYKHGDLERALVDPDRSLDVHMASQGRNLQCISCHQGADHRAHDHGVDLPGTQLSNKPLACDSSGCHTLAPHRALILNRHASRVNCTVCHIPTYAHDDPTDMIRDWSNPVYDAKKDKYGPGIKLEKDVRPVYAWFNGMTRQQFLGEPVQQLPDGTIGITVPEGGRQDPKAKIYAFKRHQSKLPVLAEENWLIPICVEEFFRNGKIDSAVSRAAFAVYGISDPKFTWMKTSSFIGISHEVQPAARSLKCGDCHSAGGRLNWKALGYTGDPVGTSPGTKMTGSAGKQ